MSPNDGTGPGSTLGFQPSAAPAWTQDSLDTLRARVRADAAAIRCRRAVPHLHGCPVCYGRWPCFASCALEPDQEGDDGLPAGCRCVCGVCLLRAGLPVDDFVTGLPDPPAVMSDDERSLLMLLADPRAGARPLLSALALVLGISCEAARVASRDLACRGLIAHVGKHHARLAMTVRGFSVVMETIDP